MDDVFINYDITELKRSSKIFFFCFCTASVGGSGLILDDDSINFSPLLFCSSTRFSHYKNEWLFGVKIC